MRRVGADGVGEEDVPVALGDRGYDAQRGRSDGKSAAAVIVVLVVGLGRIVELELLGGHEDRLMRLFAEIDFGAGEFEAGVEHLHRRVADQQFRQAGGADAAGLRQHQAVAVRVGEVDVDPTVLRVAQLIQVELARGQQRLAQLAVDDVAVDVRIGVSVRPRRLGLAERVMEGAPVPQADVVEQG